MPTLVSAIPDFWIHLDDARHGLSGAYHTHLEDCPTCRTASAERSEGRDAGQTRCALGARLLDALLLVYHLLDSRLVR